MACEDNHNKMLTQASDNIQSHDVRQGIEIKHANTSHKVTTTELEVFAQGRIEEFPETD